MEISEIAESIIRVRQGSLEYPAIVLRLVGISPLLMNNPAAMGLPSTKDPKEDAVARAYRLPDRRLAFPAGACRASICNGGAGHKMGRTAMNTVLFQKTLVDEVLRPLEREGESITDYTVDARRCVVQRAGILRGRPMIETPWSIAVTVMWDIDASYESEHAAFAKSIIESATRAGRSIGIGDYRPQHRGSFGRFMVEVI